jgi:hypothetical protein
MTVPSKIFALEDEVASSGIASAEWAVLERYHRGIQPDNWSQSDKVTLTSAFQKAYCYPRVSSDADLIKISKWIEEGYEEIAGSPHPTGAKLI